MLKKISFISFFSIILFLTAIFITNKPRIQWIEGDKKMYSFEYNSHSNQKSKLLDNNTITYDISISGTLNMRVFEIKDGIIKAGFQLSDVKYTQNGDSIPQMEKLYSSFFLAEFEETGKPIKYILNNNISYKEEPMVTGLVNSLQVVVRPGLFDYGWKTSEDDNIGTYETVYSSPRVLPGEFSLKKSRIEYIDIRKSIISSNGSDMVISIPVSDFSFALAKKTSWIKSASGSEETIYTTSGNDVTIKNKIDLFMDEVPFNPDPSLELFTIDSYSSALESFASAPKKEMSTFEEEKYKKLKEKYTGENLYGIVSSWEKYKGEDVPTPEEINALIDFLNAKPDEAYKIQDLLLTSKMSDSAKALLIAALKSSATPQAQKTILNIYEDNRQEEKYRSGAISMIGNITERPVTEETFRKLIEIYQSKIEDPKERVIANCSILSIGKMARWQASLDDPRALAIIEKSKNFVKSELTSLSPQSDGNQIAAVFGAVSNTKDPKFTPAVSEYITSDAPKLRKYAAETLGYLPDSETTSILKKQLPAEKDNDVRIAIIDGLNKKDFDEDTYSYIKSTLPSDESVYARKSMIDYIIDKRKSISDYKAVLEDQLSRETNDSNIKEIKRALYTDYYN